MALIPTWFLQSYLPQIPTKLFTSIIRIADNKFYKLITSVGAWIFIHVLMLLLYNPKF